MNLLLFVLEFSIVLAGIALVPGRVEPRIYDLREARNDCQRD